MDDLIQNLLSFRSTSSQAGPSGMMVNPEASTKISFYELLSALLKENDIGVQKTEELKKQIEEFYAQRIEEQEVSKLFQHYFGKEAFTKSLQDCAAEKKRVAQEKERREQNAALKAASTSLSRECNVEPLPIFLPCFFCGCFVKTFVSQYGNFSIGSCKFSFLHTHLP